MLWYIPAYNLISTILNQNGSFMIRYIREKDFTQIFKKLEI